MNMFISDCGQFLAIKPEGAGPGNYDVISVDGSRIWLGGRYRPTGRDDTDPRFLYPEFRFMVSCFSNHGYTNRAGRYVEDFELWFGEYDTSKLIEPGRGNTRLNSQKARFRKSIKRLYYQRKTP
jgi:hypothetical protein